MIRDNAPSPRVGGFHVTGRSNRSAAALLEHASHPLGSSSPLRATAAPGFVDARVADPLSSAGDHVCVDIAQWVTTQPSARLPQPVRAPLFEVRSVRAFDCVFRRTTLLSGPQAYACAETAAPWPALSGSRRIRRINSSPMVTRSDASSRSGSRARQPRSICGLNRRLSFPVRARPRPAPPARAAAQPRPPGAAATAEAIRHDLNRALNVSQARKSRDSTCATDPSRTEPGTQEPQAGSAIAAKGGALRDQSTCRRTGGSRQTARPPSRNRSLFKMCHKGFGVKTVAAFSNTTIARFFY